MAQRIGLLPARPPRRGRPATGKEGKPLSPPHITAINRMEDGSKWSVACSVGSLLVLLFLLLLPVFSVGLIHSHCRRSHSHTCTVGETAEPMATTSGAAVDDVANGSQEHSLTHSTPLSPLPVILLLLLGFSCSKLRINCRSFCDVCAPPACVKTFTRFPR